MEFTKDKNDKGAAPGTSTAKKEDSQRAWLSHLKKRFDNKDEINGVAPDEYKEVYRDDSHDDWFSRLRRQFGDNKPPNPARPKTGIRGSFEKLEAAFDGIGEITELIQAIKVAMSYPGSPASNLGDNFIHRLEDFLLCILQISSCDSSKMMVLSALTYAKTFCSKSLVNTIRDLVLSREHLRHESGGDVSPRDVIANWRVYRDHPIAKFLSDLVTMLSIAGLVPNYGENILCSEIYDLLGARINKSYTSATRFLDVVAGIVTFVCKYVVPCVQKKDLGLLLLPDEELLTLDDRYTDVLGCKYYLDIGRVDMIGSETNNFGGLHDLLYECNDLVSELSKICSKSNSPYVQNICSTKMLNLKKFRSCIEAEMEETPLKAEAFMVKIYGRSSVMKSKVMLILADALAHSMNIPFTHETVCHRNPDEKNYDSDCTPKHRIILNDDMSALSPKMAKESSIGSVLRCCNMTPQSIVKPDVDSKGKMKYNVELALGTTNVWNMFVDAYMAEPAAILRRFNAHLHVKLRPEATATHGGPVSDYAHGLYPDAWLIDLYTVKLERCDEKPGHHQPGGYSYVKHMSDASILEIIEVLSAWARDWSETMKVAVVESNAYFGAAHCEHGLISDGCPHCMKIRHESGSSDDEIRRLEDFVYSNVPTQFLEPDCYQTDSEVIDHFHFRIAEYRSDEQRVIDRQVIEAMEEYHYLTGRDLFFTDEGHEWDITNVQLQDEIEESDLQHPDDVELLGEHPMVDEEELDEYLMEFNDHPGRFGHHGFGYYSCMSAEELRSACVEVLLGKNRAASYEPNLQHQAGSPYSSEGVQVPSSELPEDNVTEIERTPSLVATVKSVLEEYSKEIVGASAFILGVIGIMKLWNVAQKTVEHQGARASAEQVPNLRVTDKPNPWKKVSFEEVPRSLKSATTSFSDLTAKLSKSIGIFEYTAFYDDRRNPDYCMAIPFRENVWIVPYHAVRTYDVAKVTIRLGGILEVGKKRATDVISSDHWVRVPGKDVALVRLPGAGDVPDLSHFIPPEDSDLTSRPMCGVIREFSGKEKTTLFDMGRRTKVPSINGDKEYAGLKWSYNLEFPTYVGLCSMPIVLREKRPVICAMHVAGTEGGAYGVAESLVSDELEDAFNLLNKKCEFRSMSSGDFPEEMVGKKIVLHSGNVHRKHCANYIPDTGAFGKMHGFALLGSHELGRTSFRSNVRESPISTEVWEETGVPRIHGPPMPKPQYYNYQRELEAISGAQTEFHPLILKAAFEAEWEFWKKILQEEDTSEVKPLPDIFAVNGADGIKGLDKMDRNTSAGLPFKLKKKILMKRLENGRASAEDIAQLITEPWDFTEESGVWQEVDRIKECFRQGIRAYLPVSATEKDEPTRFDKEKRRIFGCCPVAMVVLIRKYFLPIIRFIQTHWKKTGSGVGINATGNDWHELFKLLAKFPVNRCVAGDYKAFDKEVAAAINMRSNYIFIRIAEFCGYSEDDLCIMRGLITEVVYPLYDWDGVFLILFNSLPSGVPHTVHINNITNRLYLRYAYYAEYVERGYSVLTLLNTLPRLEYVIALMLYGDDNIFTVSPDEEHFNHSVVQRQLAKIGVVYTMADKISESRPFIHIDEADFLKRKFFRHDNGYITAPLAEESIFKSLHNYMHNKRSDDLPEQLAVNACSSAVREFFQHGKLKFEERRDQLTRVLERKSYTVGGMEKSLLTFLPNCQLPTWEECTENYVATIPDEDGELVHQSGRAFCGDEFVPYTTDFLDHCAPAFREPAWLEFILRFAGAGLFIFSALRLKGRVRLSKPVPQIKYFYFFRFMIEGPSCVFYDIMQDLCLMGYCLFSLWWLELICSGNYRYANYEASDLLENCVIKCPRSIKTRSRAQPCADR